MMQTSTRRGLIGAAAAVSALALLPACATGTDRYSLVEVVRRLLLASSERAFDRLLSPDGFLTDSTAAIDVPIELRTDRDRASRVIGLLLSTSIVQDRLRRELSHAAADGARAVAPFVAESVRNMSVADAAAVLSGGPGAATALLRGAISGRMLDLLFPEVSRSLGRGDSEIVAQALRVATGFDIAGLARNVAGQTGNAVFRAIEREEREIRADPRSTRDPVLIGALSRLG